MVGQAIGAWPRTISAKDMPNPLILQSPTNLQLATLPSHIDTHVAVDGSNFEARR